MGSHVSDLVSQLAEALCAAFEVARVRLLIAVGLDVCFQDPFRAV